MRHTKEDKIKVARHLLVVQQYSYREANGVLFDLFGKGMSLLELQRIKASPSVPTLTTTDIDAMKNRITDAITQLKMDIKQLEIAITLLDQVNQHITNTKK